MLDRCCVSSAILKQQVGTIGGLDYKLSKKALFNAGQEPNVVQSSDCTHPKNSWLPFYQLCYSQISMYPVGLKQT